MAYQGAIGTSNGGFLRARTGLDNWTNLRGIDHASGAIVWKLATWGWWTTPTAFALLQARELTGPGRLSGDIKKNGALVARRILLVDRKQRAVVHSVMSTGLGVFEFTGLPTDSRRFMVIGLFDPDTEETAVADYLTAG